METFLLPLACEFPVMSLDFVRHHRSQGLAAKDCQDTMNQLRVFTVKEANEALLRLAPLLEELRATRDAILNLEVEIDALELVSDKKKDKASPIVNKKLKSIPKP